MAAFEPGIYKNILKVRKAWLFDIGGLLMRFYYYMTNIGVVSMLTLAGYSFFYAGLVSSTVALSVFLVSPHIAKTIDSKGQSKILPKVAFMPIIGTVGMLLSVSLNAPIWTFFPLAILMGSSPAAQALVRARWTYLIRTGNKSVKGLTISGVFAYESIIDDVAFMFSPALSIFLASTIAPIAGLAFGIGCFSLGAFLLTRSKWSEPVPGWVPAPESEGEAPNAPQNQNDFELSNKSIFRTSSVVRALFAMMLCLGAFFGSLDTTSISFAEEMGNPNIASMALMMQAFTSVIMGFLFGMLKIPLPQWARLVITATLFGCAFGCCFFIDSVFLFFAITIPASLTYAPFLITVNSTCERAVPGSKFTEAITWVNAGCTCGMTIGPSLAGIVIDAYGTMAMFKLSGIIVFATALIAVICAPIFKHKVK